MKEEIREQIEKDREKLVIVEGVKDKRALESLGFSNVNFLNKNLIEFCEGFCEKEVLILTDLDREGKKLYSTGCNTI